MPTCASQFFYNSLRIIFSNTRYSIMSAQQKISTCALPPSLDWQRLVERSIASWRSLNDEFSDEEKAKCADQLRQRTGVEDFLAQTSSGDIGLFWFFQRRKPFFSQETLTKWNADNLEQYVLIPARPYIHPMANVFMSHFWLTKEHPDPDGTWLHRRQERLKEVDWCMIWVDWTCLPQDPRSAFEEAYFLRVLQTMSTLIRGSFVDSLHILWEPRLWILYEVAETFFTCAPELANDPIYDPILCYGHVQEMLRTSVIVVRDRYDYRCTHDRDTAYLTSCLEVLVIVIRMGVSPDAVKSLLDSMAMHQNCGKVHHVFENNVVEVDKVDGVLTWNGDRSYFSPFPAWVSKFYRGRQRLLTNFNRQPETTLWMMRSELCLR